MLLAACCWVGPVSWTRSGLPPRKLPGLYLDIGLLQVVGPRGEQVLPHLLVEVTRVSNECRRQETVPSDGRHLVFEGFACFFPSFAFSRQTLQKGSAPVYLEDKQQGLHREVHAVPHTVCRLGGGLGIQAGSRSQPEGDGVLAYA